jgi:RNA ligase
MFEFCSRDQRIVIDYPVADLVLLGARKNSTGDYVRRYYIESLGECYEWTVVKALSSEHSSLKDLASVVRQFKEDEGVVVTFEHGFRVKIKADEYVLKHRALDGLRFEKDVVALILGNSLDDVLPIVDEKTRGRLTAFRDSMMFQIEYHEMTLKKMFSAMKHLERREFAEVAKADPLYAKFLFKMLDGKGADVMGYVLSKTGTQANLESVRRLVGKSFLDI